MKFVDLCLFFFFLVESLKKKPVDLQSLDVYDSTKNSMRIDIFDHQIPLYVLLIFFIFCLHGSGLLY